MNILGLDFETTGLDPNTDEIIEFGAVVWDLNRQIPLKLISDFVKPSRNQISPRIQKLTGIDPTDVENYGIAIGRMVAILETIIKHWNIEYIVAHNAEFDHAFLKAVAPELVSCVPWVCSRMDVPYEDDKGVGSLMVIAAKHGFLNPFSHRACPDVLTMLKVVSHYPWDDILQFRESPMLEVMSLASFEEKDVVKAAGFYWDPDNKLWKKKIRQVVFEQERSEWNFPYRILTNEI